jgi:hypothetical protein
MVLDFAGLSVRMVLGVRQMQGEDNVLTQAAYVWTGHEGMIDVKIVEGGR